MCHSEQTTTKARIRVEFNEALDIDDKYDVRVEGGCVLKSFEDWHGAWEYAESLSEYVAVPRDSLEGTTPRQRNAWPTPTPAAAEGVARVEKFTVENGLVYFAVMRGDEYWCATSCPEWMWSNARPAGVWFCPDHESIAQAVADAINKRAGVGGGERVDIGPLVKAARIERDRRADLADRLAAADAACDAKVTTRLATDLGVTNEIAAQVAEAFRPFADLKASVEAEGVFLRETLNRHRIEVWQHVNGVTDDLRKTNRRIDRLRVSDPGHN